jgi:hypothetical protein
MPPLARGKPAVPVPTLIDNDMIEQRTRLMATQAAARRGKDSEAAKEFAAAAWEDFETDTRAIVITARAPTARMIEAGILARHRGFDASKVYSIMMDAALSQDTVITSEKHEDQRSSTASFATASQSRSDYRPRKHVAEPRRSGDGCGSPSEIRNAAYLSSAVPVQPTAATITAWQVSDIGS